LNEQMGLSVSDRGRYAAKIDILSVYEKVAS
jgi:hypothetical protein